MYPGSLRTVLDTYQRMAKIFARDVLHATFFLPRGDADYPQAIAGRIDYMHQMLRLQTNEALCDELHPVCKEYLKPGGRAALRLFPKDGTDEKMTVDLKGPESALFVKALGKTQFSSAPALSATDFFLLLFRQVCSELRVRSWKLPGYHMNFFCHLIQSPTRSRGQRRAACSCLQSAVNP